MAEITREYSHYPEGRDLAQELDQMLMRGVAPQILAQWVSAHQMVILQGLRLASPLDRQTDP